MLATYAYKKYKSHKEKKRLEKESANEPVTTTQNQSFTPPTFGPTVASNKQPTQAGVLEREEGREGRSSFEEAKRGVVGS